MHETHGRRATRVYNIWASMKQRCDDSNSKSYPNYGGRGIHYCDRWKKFENFWIDMGDPPDGHTLDRIDNDGNYSPENCRWASRTEQRRNRRDPLHVITWSGRTQCVADWEKELGFRHNMLRKRLLRNKMSLQEAMTPHSLLNVKHTQNGKSLTVAEWAEETGIAANTIKMRMHRGKTLAEALQIDPPRAPGGGRKNSLGEPGICWDNTRKKFLVRIKSKQYGRFNTLQAAIECRDLNTGL